MRRHHIRASLCLLVVALIAGVTGCAGETRSTVKYDLTIASGAGGSVTVPGEGTFTCDSGRIVDLVATQASGYRFVNWTGSVGTIANPYAASTTITVDGDYSITANFEQAEGTYYTLTMAVAGSGSTTPAAGQHTYAAGAVISISATAASGYHFVGWTGNVGSVANVNAASTTITMNSNYTITAGFEQTAVTYYTLTIAAIGSGSTSPAVGQHSYAAGTLVSIIASATGDYYFVNWTGNVDTVADGDAASTTITMTGNYSITANFELALPYTLTMAVAGSGSTNPVVGQHTYTAGTSVPITATPTGSYYFSHWTAPAGSFTNANSLTTTFTMPGQDVTVTANFVEGGPPFPPGPYSLTISSTTGGSVTVTIGGQDTAVAPGQTQTIADITAGTGVSLVASPNAGYHFVNWTGSPVNDITSTTTSFSMQSNYSIIANFAVQTMEYDLAVSSTSGGSVTITIGGQDTVVVPGQPQTISDITAGTGVSLTASHNAGYYFVNWTGSPVNDITSTTTSFSMQSNYSIIANFAVGAPEYDISISSTTGGSVTVTIGGQDTAVGPGQTQTIADITAGTGVSLVASPNAGYHFVNWSGAPVNGITSTTTGFSMQSDYAITANFETVTFMISAGDLHTVGVKSDGTVFAVGDNTYGQCNVGSWTDITQVAAGGFHTVGLKSNGTVVAAGNNGYGQCDVSDWTSITQVAADGYHTVGLKSDGTAVAVGYNYHGQCNVGAWTKLIQVCAGGFHTVGLKSDGTAVATGNNWYGQRNVSGWTNIMQVIAGDAHTAGLKSDGTMVAVGYNYHGQCNVGGWTNVVRIAAGGSHTVGLSASGTVVAAGDNYHGQRNVSNWTGIIQMTAGWQHTAGIKSNGTVVAVGWNEYGQCNVGGWDLN